MMTPTEMHIDALMEKIAKLEAENATLRLGRDSWQKEAEANEEWAVELKAENARYREALEEVISEGCSDLCQNMKRYRPSYTCHVEIAREALKGE